MAVSPTAARVVPSAEMATFRQPWSEIRGVHVAPASEETYTLPDDAEATNREPSADEAIDVQLRLSPKEKEAIKAITQKEVKKMEKKELKEELFLPPAGYQKIVPDVPKK